MDKASVTLSASEWRVMEALWTGPKTLMELVRELGVSEEKGLIAYEQSGRAKVFRPAVSREAVAAAETDSLLSRAYHGSVGLLVNALAERESLSQADIDELYAVLRRAEEGRS